MCFGTDCADVPPAFAKALISTEKGAYAQAYQDGESAERREMSAAKPHQVRAHSHAHMHTHTHTQASC